LGSISSTDYALGVIGGSFLKSKFTRIREVIISILTISRTKSGEAGTIILGQVAGSFVNMKVIAYPVLIDV
jgi:hypothetical protein